MLDVKMDTAAAKMLLARGVAVRDVASCLGRSVMFVNKVGGGGRVKGKGKGNLARNHAR